MKKKLTLLLVLLFSIVMLPTAVKAETTYKTLNFKEALAEEEIEAKFTDYKETDDQAIIYLFRGKGCGYCRAFLEFMNSITDEYGKYFKIVSYEVWNDSANSQLLTEVSNFLGQPAGGVPYIVIGDKVFAGYASAYDDEIKETIDAMYKTKKKDRYDVMEDMKKKNGKDGSSLSNSSVWVIIICNLVVTIVASLIIMSHINNKYNELYKMLETKNTRPEKEISKPKSKK